MADIFDYLTAHSLRYQRFDHPPVMTCTAAREALPDAPGTPTKNLFLRDDKGQRHFLLVARDDKQINLKELSALIGVKKLGFASPERLRTYLGIEPGAVTLLGLINDTEKHVQVIVDHDLTVCEAIHCHPLVNTSTLVIPWRDVLNFIALTGHDVRVIDLPL
jgi:Ala-tRNA(Pro) deacylase